MILDGRIVAASVYEELKQRIARLVVPPKLVVFLVGDDPASIAYIGQKKKYSAKIGMDFELVRLSADTPESALLARLDEKNSDPSVSGIIVQTPLPRHIDTERVIAHIAPAKDVDGFTPASLGELFLGRDNFTSCTPKGVMRLLEYYDISPSGKRVAILGRSNIVGKPLAVLMINAGATVTSCNSKTRDIARITLDADIVVLAMGQPKFLTRDMVREGAVIVDVGFKKVDGIISGDADYDALESVTDITPVPGGVGAMTVAMLLENTLLAAERSRRDER
jgi:methylenetetrahydrofolate dehydrogenase (NADP+) / methenyltetrahydrofolate cyclohydrolase